ncbi:MAG TPA: BBE domain-containing protein [Desulfobacterales bacterium]|nr:BBE domain-containing protein [Desulfobacterales bacterium]
MPKDAFDGLKTRLRGPGYLPGGAGYEESRTVWNAMIDRKPVAIARCLGGADVIAGVRFAREHDLLLCIKGGGHNIAGLAMADGGNFGVVSGIDYSLFPVGPEIVGGLVAWPASEAPGVLELYRTLAEQASPELTLAALLRPAPPAPWLPREVHGKPIVAILACHSGGVEHGEKSVAPIKSFGKPIGDVLVRRPYTQLQSMLDATQPKGRRYYWKSEYLPRVEPALLEKAIGHAAKIRSLRSAVILFQIGGALNNLKEDYAPVGNRDARSVLNIAGSWELAGEDAMNIEWARNAWKDLKSFSTGGTYISFLTDDESSARVKAALGKGLKRLTEVKATWDPQNVFHTNRNNKPG